MVKLMNDDTTLETLAAAVRTAQRALATAERELAAFKAQPSQHVYDTLDDATSTLEDLMNDWAHEACEGSHCMGMDEYTQEFIVDGKHYIAKLECEYDRHDKTYYYVYGSTFSYSEVPDAS
jgi:hypothetical protein